MHRRALATYASATTEADDLIQRYGTLIDRVARRIVLRIGLHSAFDDLWSARALGLLEASGRFDAARGAMVRDRMSTHWQRQQKAREEKLKNIEEQVESGSLVIRKMTKEERRRYPPRPARPKRNSKR